MEKTIWPVIIGYADRFDPDPGHAREVCRLSALLFKALGELHTYEKKERDILKSAALLHDIGWSRPQIAHHKASRDIILADRTIPFSNRERKMVSLIARYHRKTSPKPDHAVFRDLDGADQQIVIFCSGILRIADSLDRAHQNAVSDLTCTIGDDELIISITCRHPSLIDIAVFSEKSQLFGNYHKPQDFPYMHLKKPRVVGFIDLGTNSVRLLVVRLNTNGSYTLLTQQKEVIRLGEGEYPANRLTITAIERAISVITKLIELAKSRGVEEFVAVATSAAREAENGEELCLHIEDLTGIRIHIISGTEEARLIWLGVSSGIDIRDEKALFIDIGGGSTEIIVGDQHEPSILRSLKLGAIRTTGTLINPEKDGKISPDTLKQVRRHIEHEIVHIAKQIRVLSVTRAFGSSGTILALETIASSYKPFQSTHVSGFLGTDELEAIISYLSGLPLEARKNVQGLNPERADIIVAGALILHEILKATKVSGIFVSNRSLRDGLLVDYISRIPEFPHAEQVSIRERSVRHLGKLCHIDEKHAAHIVKLSLQLYHSAIRSKLFKYQEESEELLTHAAYLHDVGQFISFSNHHQHSFYLITEVPLLGFNQYEVLMIGLVARYHRKKLPRSRDVPFQELGRTERRTVRILSLLLRMAENLDRSHNCRIEKAEFSRDKESIVLSISCISDCSLEFWAIESEKDTFFRTFRLPLHIEYIPLDHK